MLPAPACMLCTEAPGLRLPTLPRARSPLQCKVPPGGACGGLQSKCFLRLPGNPCGPESLHGHPPGTAVPPSTHCLQRAPGHRSGCRACLRFAGHCTATATAKATFCRRGCGFWAQAVPKPSRCGTIRIQGEFPRKEVKHVLAIFLRLDIYTADPGADPLHVGAVPRFQHVQPLQQGARLFGHDRHADGRTAPARRGRLRCLRRAHARQPLRPL